MLGHEEDIHLSFNMLEEMRAVEKKKGKGTLENAEEGIATRFVIWGVLLEMVSFPNYLLS